jgi:hypothetical protein
MCATEPEPATSVGPYGGGAHRRERAGLKLIALSASSRAIDKLLPHNEQPT